MKTGKSGTSTAAAGRMGKLALGMAGSMIVVAGLAAVSSKARADGGGGGGGGGGTVPIPTNAPGPSYVPPGMGKFNQPMPRFDVLPRLPVTALSPAPTEQSNYTQQSVDLKLGGGTGPIEGRPPGPLWAHQGWADHFPQVAIEVNMQGAQVNTTYNPGVPASLNSGINPAAPVHPRFHPMLPDQGPLKMWTFNGTLPPKLVMGRYGEAILFREHNKLPVDKTQNGGFGMNSISTHEHNGHHGAENDGFTGAYFFPNQFYDYHWPIVLAGFTSMNNAPPANPMAATPDDSFGSKLIAGDWHETMSTHWFHDHMFSFTSQNVYKGMAGMFNIYSGLDRGNEAVNDGVNLRLPSGTAKSWGNLDYDVNLMLADKAWDPSFPAQLWFNIFNFDGFLGDRMTVNLVDNPYFEVEARKYRFRVLNASVSRFFKLALSDGSTMIQIGNDGNLLPHPVALTELDEMGIAERYDIVIDFSRYPVGANVGLVNLCEHQNGKKPSKDLSLSEALAGTSADPVVGKFLEFRVVRRPAQPDLSQVPDTLIPNPDLSTLAVAKQRTFEFGSGATQTTTGPTSFTGPWGVKVDNAGATLAADYGRLSAAPSAGTREVWTLQNGGGGWDHPVHIHFEEGQILARNGSASNVPAWELGRKDVYRLRPGGSVTLTMQFRDWGGTFMEHCHNTVHEDNAMLVRWEIDNSGAPFMRPLPTPISTPQGCSYVAPDEVIPTAF